ncbi:MAG: glycosyltransferase [Dehalococcoidia bacterium]|nr:glycosyltransferase [Dehalococcoidia bacterium]
MIASGAALPGGFSPAVKAPRNQLLIGAVASIVSIAVIAGLLDVSELRSGLRIVPEQPATIALMALAYSAAFWLRALAWRLILTSPISTARLFSILQTGLFLNHLLPSKAGEIARPYLASRHGVPAAEAASTTLVSRLLDLAALAAIAVVALPALAGSTELGLALLTAVSLIAAALLALTGLRWRLPPSLAPALQRPLATIQTALRQISLSRLGLAAPFVVASWLLEAVVLLGAARFLGADISIETAAGATAFTILFQVFHFTPGGIGVYETSMTSILALQGVPAETALGLAVLTHGLKFAYSFTVGLAFTAGEAISLVRQKAGEEPRKASRFEIVSARLWNVINEGKPFTPVFFLSIVLLLSLPHLTDAAYWPRAGMALLLLAPLSLLFWRYDFPLKLRTALWLLLAAFVAFFQHFEVVPALIIVSLYLTFTVFVWGSVYYHLRIGTPLTNFLRFWRLVLENPDPTSGNFQEQLPKLLILVMAFRYLVQETGWQAAVEIQIFTAVVGLTALLLHQWLFTWVPALPQPLPGGNQQPSQRVSRRVIAIVIDGCRADRLDEANTPFIDKLRREGAVFTDMHTVYPARTVTGFSSMLTGAAPKTHGMRSNFVPSLGVKCDSVFAALRREGLKGKLVGIAHLIDAFGEEDVASVTAVMHNDEIDFALEARARSVLEAEAPDLLLLQLLSVDQTGHARGSYNDEYLRKIEATDRTIEGFIAWCEARGYLDEATLLITSDHGQGIGIGGHGHMSPPEIHVPCIFWGAGVPAGLVNAEPAFVTDLAQTICGLLGVAPPRDSVGRVLVPVAEPARRPLVFAIPAHDEATNLPDVIAAIRHAAAGDTEIVVVDDGSSDRTAAVARDGGAIVVSHETNRGLGAALRTGLTTARELNARAAVYLDADGEYDAREFDRLLAPIERGEADYVLGSRFQGSVEGMTWSRRVANRGFSALLSLLCGRWISDGQTGFRAFSPRAMDVAEIIHDYNYAQVLTMDLLHKGMRLQEVPVSYHRRVRGSSFVSPQYLWRVPLGMAREMLSD